MTTYVKCANCGLEMTLPRPVREWHEPRHEDHLRYAFIESLPSDSPPFLLRSSHSLRYSDGLEAFVIDTAEKTLAVLDAQRLGGPDESGLCLRAT